MPSEIGPVPPWAARHPAGAAPRPAPDMGRRLDHQDMLDHQGRGHQVKARSTAAPAARRLRERLDREIGEGGALCEESMGLLWPRGCENA
jgi:hypothetical protein